jgi:hypothetical protein
VEEVRIPLERRHGDEPRAERAEPARDRAGEVLALQRSAGNQAVAAMVARGAGRPLPRSTRVRMEEAFGTSFEAVRVHEEPEVQALGAQAFTRGEDVHFAPGRFEPGSDAGAELIGHELAHVVQQRAGRVTGAQGKGMAVVADAALEQEADRAGALAARGRPAGVPVGGSAAPGDVIQGKFELAFAVGDAFAKTFDEHREWEQQRKEQAKAGRLEASADNLRMNDITQQLEKLKELSRRLVLIETDQNQVTLQHVNTFIRNQTQQGASRQHLGLTQNRTLRLGSYRLVCTHPGTDKELYAFEIAVVNRGEDENAARQRDAQQGVQRDQDLQQFFAANRSVAAAATPKFRQDHVSGSPSGKNWYRSAERGLDNTVVELTQDSTELLIQEAKLRNQPGKGRAGEIYTTDHNYIQIDSKGWFAGRFKYAVRSHDNDGAHIPVLKIHHYEGPTEHLAADSHPQAQEWFAQWNASALKKIHKRKVKAAKPGPAAPVVAVNAVPNIRQDADDLVPATPTMVTWLKRIQVGAAVGTLIYISWLMAAGYGESETQ